MKYNIKDAWITAFETVVKNPIVIMPFVVIGFLECLGLEIAYFSTRFPLSYIFDPLIKKFHGEPFVHYPANLIVLPKLFYNAQVLIYISIGVFMAAVSVQMIANIWTNHPVVPKAIVKNTLKRYVTLATYGIGYIVLVYLIEKAGGFAILKGSSFISHHFFKMSTILYSTVSLLFMVLSILIVQTFIILTVPIIVLEKKGLLKAIKESLVMAMRNFLTIFTLMLLPFILYLPVLLMKAFSTSFMDKTFPEMSVIILFLNILMSIFVDSFIMVSVTQFLLKEKKIS